MNIAIKTVIGEVRWFVTNNKYLSYVIYYLSKDIYRSAIIANCQKTYYEENNLSVW